MANLSRLPMPVFEAYEWQEEGACRNADVEQFFVPEGLTAGERIRRERASKLICARCPVRERCLSHAMSAQEPFGVWGGLSAAERRRLRNLQAAS